MATTHDSFDYALVGGGLQNGLLALALRHHQPHARVVLLERDDRLGGNHTWCLHAGDVTADVRAWLEPLVVHRWPGYAVAFADLQRRVALGYQAMTADRLRAVVGAALDQPGCAVHVNARAVAVEAHHVTLSDGRRIAAQVVLRAQGPDHATLASGTGWQKFVGLELRTQTPHGLTEPILMDARVPQVDGMRFVYTLPLAPDRLLVEDTVFADDALLDVDAMRAGALTYAHAQGWLVADVLREERGVLPMPWEAPPHAVDDCFALGMEGGWFHPATGYSLAVAARLADAIARAPAHQVRDAITPLRRRHDGQSAFARRLNWALFCLAAPEHRHAMMARFYRRPDAVIQRFFALDLHLLDAARIVLGAPPRHMRWWPRQVLPLTMQEAKP